MLFCMSILHCLALPSSHAPRRPPQPTSHLLHKDSEACHRGSFIFSYIKAPILYCFIICYKLLCLTALLHFWWFLCFLFFFMFSCPFLAWVMMTQLDQLISSVSSQRNHSSLCRWQPKHKALWQIIQTLHARPELEIHFHHYSLFFCLYWLPASLVLKLTGLRTPFPSFKSFFLTKHLRLLFMFQRLLFLESRINPIHFFCRHQTSNTIFQAVRLTLIKPREIVHKSLKTQWKGKGSF